MFRGTSHRLAALAAGVLAGLSLTLIASSSPSGAEADDLGGRTDTLEIIGKRGVSTLPDLPAPGLGFIVGGELTSPSGAKLGEGYSGCSIVKLGVEVPPTFTSQCTTTFVLGEDELHMSSLREYKPGTSGFEKTKLAIVGGTGKYAGATGDGEGVRQTARDGAVAYLFTLNVRLG